MKKVESNFRFFLDTLVGKFHIGGIQFEFQDSVQRNLFDERDRIEREKVLEVMDKVHKKYGTRVLKVATQGIGGK